MPKITVTVSAHIKHGIQEYAEAVDRSVSNFILHAVKSYMHRLPKNNKLGIRIDISNERGVQVPANGNIKEDKP